jgi:hypothetical protein
MRSATLDGTPRATDFRIMDRFSNFDTKLALPAAFLLGSMLVAGPALALPRSMEDPDTVVGLGIMLVGIVIVSALVGVLVLLLFALRETTKSAPREAPES